MKSHSEKDLPYVSPKELALRWNCSRSSVDRIARKNGLSALYLGYGKNGMVRYLWEEVIAYEKSRQIALSS